MAVDSSSSSPSILMAANSSNQKELWCVEYWLLHELGMIGLFLVPNKDAKEELQCMSRRVLNANNLTGKLPEELNHLTNLIELRLSSNNFSGKIPNFNLTKLQKLEIQGSGLEGPIPETIFYLGNLTELRISDLSGKTSQIPDLYYMENMTKLMLRGCNITGTIPASISEIRTESAKADDLEGLNLQKLYLTGNSLCGSIPDWIKNRGDKSEIDLSYNRFSEKSVPESCGKSLNLFRSYSGEDNLDLAVCLKEYSCSKEYYSVHINCGGPRVTIGHTFYEADQDLARAAHFIPTSDHWGLSNTGSLWDTNDTSNEYIATIVSVLAVNHTELYRTARHSPLSLTYYGRCLANGNYTVTLHFAEIVFRDNKSYQDLGRRVFDVYVQNFDIKNEAGGVDKEIVKTIKNVTVTNKTLEIRLQYAGKGSTAVPQRGLYGPLISAVSLESHPKPYGRKKIYISVASVAAVLCLILIVLGIAWQRGYIGDRLSREKGPRMEINWATRKKICIGIAKGLAYLHEESVLKMVHRDIKATNVLLDSDLTPKISDFGLAKLHEEENTHIITKIAGTMGYMAPEYALWGHLTYKADVYSFGVLALEIVAGKNNMRYRPSEDYYCLLDFAVVMKQKGSLLELVDARLGSDFNKKEAVRIMKIALLCTNQSSALRPTMSQVVNMLEGRTKIIEPSMISSKYDAELGVQELREKLEKMHSNDSEETESLLKASSSSLHNLFSS
ncbi:putative leucine-rich repeat receptor-like serine/threonine-protein kinase [Artemisia annua]|uniref:non-specific serine/threonine protein kinase n=1 Tax=Artemisia annua TaxID=35608 RepID=A0A2U1M9M8_ARTAN|nr:putative leucine-rich repeat receptor-like serine/threonine-protein kinase [Artemisia annua]